MNLFPGRKAITEAADSAAADVTDTAASVQRAADIAAVAFTLVAVAALLVMFRELSR